MKKAYSRPLLEIEAYTLSASIASHCGIVVHNGPEAPGHSQCSDYGDPFATIKQPDAGIMSGSYNVQFYEDTKICDCYTTGGDYGYWTS